MSAMISAFVETPFDCTIFCNFQMMKEIEGALASLEKDKSCKLVLLTSANSSFCSGTDYSTLTAANEKERLAAANELAKKIR